jgi:hypothetical protein
VLRGLIVNEHDEILVRKCRRHCVKTDHDR